MKFLSSFLVLIFAVVMFSCQSGVSAPEKEDYSKLEGLVTQIEDQMQTLRKEMEQITDNNEFLLQKRDTIQNGREHV
jgi:cell division protein FtsB